MVDPRDDAGREYNRGYSDAQRSNSQGSLLGFLIGALIVAVLGVGAYFIFAGQPQEADSPDIINVPTPEAPDAPNINIEAPEPPKVEVQVPEAPVAPEPDANTEAPEPPRSEAPSPDGGQPAAEEEAAGDTSSAGSAEPTGEQE